MNHIDISKKHDASYYENDEEEVKKDMKTKQEILKENYELVTSKSKSNWDAWGKIISDKETTQITFSAMDEHAKQVAVEFWRWYFIEYKVDTSKEMSVEDVFDQFRKEREL